MGNFLAFRAMKVAGTSGGKLLLPDGTVHELHQPNSVAELMLEHPGLFVVDAQSLSAARNSAFKATPLPADHALDPKKVYLMLPMTRGKASAQVVEEARRALEAMTGPKSNSWASWVKKVGSRRKDIVAVAAAAKAEEGRKVITQMAMERGGKAGGGCEWTLQGASDDVTELLTRQYSGSRGWKPSLHTIEERCLRVQKVPHWLF